MTVVNKNYRDQAAPLDVSDEYNKCSFAQSQPLEFEGKKVGVRIFPNDDTPRTFISCNLVNCELPPGSVTIKCNTSLVVRAVTKITDTLIIDGETINVEELFDYIHGRYDAITESYIYHQSPIEVSH